MGPLGPDAMVMLSIMAPLAFGSIIVTALIVFFKLKKKELEMRGNPELGPVVDALRDDADDTRAQLADIQERLDFAERLLTAGREDKSG